MNSHQKRVTIESSSPILHILYKSDPFDSYVLFVGLTSRGGGLLKCVTNKQIPSERDATESRTGFV